MKSSQRSSWSAARSPLEHAVEGVLSHLAADPRAAGAAPESANVVVLGGGTGLSTVLGGNSALSAWPAQAAQGLLTEFDGVSVGVCTTDDGGSTGELVRRLPMIGIGDLRKVMLSMADRPTLLRCYGADAPVLAILQQVVQHRFQDRAPRRDEWLDPIRVLPPSLRKMTPAALREGLAALTRAVPPEVEARMRVPGHSFGNLLLAAAVFRGMEDPTAIPGRAALDRAIRDVGDLLGVPGSRLFAATASPGSLLFEYANGVLATGQSRAAKARRGCAVRRVQIAFPPRVRAHPVLLQRIREADLILYAPGSLYSSMLPVLLTPGVAEAIRGNARAIKILGANLWIQEGETDMSFREESRGFWVSELIEAYGHNVPGGIDGLFDAVLATSMDTVPGSIIRNYALEGKHPIHLDRARVAQLGVRPIEASLFASGHWHRHAMLHHDPARFAAAVRVLYAGLQNEGEAGRGRRVSRASASAAPTDGGATAPAVIAGKPASVRMNSVREILAQKRIATAFLRAAFEEFLWDYPDIPVEHLAFMRGVRVVRANQWKRSREWDNLLGYYDPDSGMICLHEQAVAPPHRLASTLAIALGESLLGNYIREKRWHLPDAPEECRRYEILLRPPRQRDCWLNDRDLRDYLASAHMQSDAADPLHFWRALPHDAGFLPSGVLFGLTYAWMLNNLFVPALDFEMRMLQWSTASLLPYQVQERHRMETRVRFFRERVFASPAQNGSVR